MQSASSLTDIKRGYPNSLTPISSTDHADAAIAKFQRSSASYRSTSCAIFVSPPICLIAWLPHVILPPLCLLFTSIWSCCGFYFPSHATYSLGGWVSSTASSATCIRDRSILVFMAFFKSPCATYSPGPINSIRPHGANLAARPRIFAIRNTSPDGSPYCMSSDGTSVFSAFPPLSLHPLICFGRVSRWGCRVTFSLLRLIVLGAIHNSHYRKGKLQPPYLQYW